MALTPPVPENVPAPVVNLGLFLIPFIGLIHTACVLRVVWMIVQGEGPLMELALWAIGAGATGGAIAVLGLPAAAHIIKHS